MATLQTSTVVDPRAGAAAVQRAAVNKTTVGQELQKMENSANANKSTIAINVPTAQTGTYTTSDGYERNKYGYYALDNIPDDVWYNNPSTGSASVPSGKSGKSSALTTGGSGGGGGGIGMMGMGMGMAQQGNGLTDYLKDAYAKNLEANLAQLKSGYDTSLNNYNAEREKLPQQYDAARNDAAAQNEIARRNFQEAAVANGLNSGTAGQADLARSAVLQGNLSNISQQQASADANIQLQMDNLAAQYQAAIAQAKANNDSELAQALYNEYVRQDENRLKVLLSDNQNAMAAYGMGMNGMGGMYGAGMGAQQNPLMYMMMNK